MCYIQNILIYTNCLLYIFHTECSLLQGFRKGQMEIQLELADIDDLVHMLPVVYVQQISICFREINHILIQKQKGLHV